MSKVRSAVAVTDDVSVSPAALTHPRPALPAMWSAVAGMVVVPNQAARIRWRAVGVTGAGSVSMAWGSTQGEGGLCRSIVPAVLAVPAVEFSVRASQMPNCRNRATVARRDLVPGLGRRRCRSGGCPSQTQRPIGWCEAA